MLLQFADQVILNGGENIFWKSYKLILLGWNGRIAATHVIFHYYLNYWFVFAYILLIFSFSEHLKTTASRPPVFDNVYHTAQTFSADDAKI